MFIFLSKAIKSIWHFDLFKTIYLNFSCFPFRDAIKMPIIVYHGTKIRSSSGGAVLKTKAKTGMIRLGCRSLGTLDPRSSTTIWEVRGRIEFGGNANFGLGSRISVFTGATLKLGNHFGTTGNTTIICQKDISFGDDCMLSWDILIMDSDWHQITNLNGSILNYPSQIRIGNHVWIGCRCTILKGVTINNNSIIAAGSLITKSCEDGNCIIFQSGGNLRILKEEVDWKREGFI